MNERILVVDDDQHLLSAFRRQLGERFTLHTVQNGNEAIAAVHESLDKKDPYAVVLCDMRMPGIDGIETLERIRALSPDTVRIMLTGNADQQTSIDSINRGQIFRFYTKPFPLDQLGDGLQAAIEQYRLVTAERELLEMTVTGCVKMLTDLVSFNDPVAHGLAIRLQQWIRIMQTNFNMPHRWQLEVAAALVAVGHLALPPELVAKRRQGATLSEIERSMLERAPEMARDLLANIPRLSKVAEIVLLQDRGFDGSGFPADGPKGEAIPLDARILKILKDLSLAVGDAPLTEAALARLDQHKEKYDPIVLGKVRTCLKALVSGKAQPAVDFLVSALKSGHELLSDVRLSNGHLIIPAHTTLTPSHITRLQNLKKIFTFIEPVKVAESSLKAAEAEKVPAH
ncbi:HD domain-containing phosphohydrolase [Telmatospirillum sp.]|uniref:HD domain-containing phosphohydrolase n=1 Tax=Telmatospirillum sp. TaxID=2079197 RepID=UPI00284A0B40|nr:HD domain-containing phosphohydrolase [Telmatospirillum sp.]MDR3436678.1 HD domain-containing phosphohydrolase [Telmatospirillum sp.]